MKLSRLWGIPIGKRHDLFFLYSQNSIVMVYSRSHANIEISVWRCTPFLYIPLALSCTLVFLFIWALGKAFLINLGTVLSFSVGREVNRRHSNVEFFYSGNVNPEEPEHSVSQCDPKRIPIQEGRSGLGHLL